MVSWFLKKIERKKPLFEDSARSKLYSLAVPHRKRIGNTL